VSHRYCMCPGCGGCSGAARRPGGQHDAKYDHQGTGPVKCPDCAAGQKVTRSAATPPNGRNTMAPRQSKLSDQMRAVRGTQVSGPEYTSMTAQAAELEARAARADELEQRASLEVNEPDMYGPGPGAHSFFADIMRVARKHCTGGGGPAAAEKRLTDSERYEHKRADRYLRQMRAERQIELAMTSTPAEAIAWQRWKAAGGTLFEKHDEMRELEQRASSSTPGQGGYFAPPIWMEEQFVHAPRAGAPLAALWTRLELPLGVGRTVSLPLFQAGNGAGTGMQTGDGAAVLGRDPADAAVTAPIGTLAAVLDASVELVDMSPVNFDFTFLTDLQEDFATQLNGQLLLGNGVNNLATSGINGQLNGLIPGGVLSAANHLWLSSTNNTSAQTWVNGQGATPGIAASAHQMTAQLYSKFARYRGLPATHWIANPDVWAIISGTADSQNRPLVELGRTVKALHGLPFVEDANLVSSFGGTTPPSIDVSAGVVSPTAGSGGYAPVLLGRWADCVYFSSAPRVRVLPEVLSGSLQVRFQVTQYLASFPNRVQWGGKSATFSGTSQAGGVNKGAAVGYGAFSQFQSNGPLSPVAAGY
jgi:HK97 family phage major capsid protein